MRRKETETNSSRSESIRSRRQAPQELPRVFSKAQINQASQKVRYASSTQRVTSRRPASTSHVNRGAVRPPSRYSVSLNVPGAEISLPALPTAKIGWRAFSGLIVIVLLPIIFFLLNSSTFQVKNFKLNGAAMVTKDDIDRVMGINGIQVVEAQPDGLEKDLLRAFPEFETAQVQVALPTNLTITVKERVPVVAWRQNENTVWVDGNGVAFGARGENPDVILVDARDNPPALPVPAAPQGKDGKPAAVEDETVKPLLSPEMVQAIQAVQPLIPTGTTVVYDAAYGLGWSDPRGWAVYLGASVKDIHDMDVKMKMYQEIVAQLEKEGITPAVISLEFTNNPFYRMEP
ncbi:MAG TPA: FtsQ-type POTRA domain-containing protein [Anaerolineaceae bacterium]|nr:FtsQ-type POTRA domain-containing protein [Anaerolineaceae bacterium]HPN51468.1 FtsQ-type POTRA domain-containing protein [Anaerolineaceae bacterium]